MAKIINKFGFSKANHNTLNGFSLNGNSYMKFLSLIDFLHFPTKLVPGIALILGFGAVNSHAQTLEYNRYSFFNTPDTVVSWRLYGMATAGVTSYGVASYTLYNQWYRDYPLGKFHLYNDWQSWQHMDKFGHVYTAWMQGYLVHRLARWTGLGDKKAAWTGVIAGTLFQATIEVMDGFSEEWGFSIPDLAANLVGTSLFAAQEFGWNEQKLLLKFSSFPKKYQEILCTGPNGDKTIDLEQRASVIFGDGFYSRLLKDYNAQTFWISFNPESVFGDFGVPDWLNIAIGYGSENLFSGMKNDWNEITSCSGFNEHYPRFHQFFIAPDINWSKIETNSPFLNSLFYLLNILKVPSPAIEFNTRDGIKAVFHWFYY